MASDDAITTPAPAAPAKDAVSLAAFVTDASTAIEVAGLITARPELAAPDARLTLDEWQAALDEYRASERP